MLIACVISGDSLFLTTKRPDQLEVDSSLEKWCSYNKQKWLKLARGYGSSNEMEKGNINREEEPT